MKSIVRLFIPITILILSGCSRPVIKITDACYPPLMVMVFIDEDSNNVNRDSYIQKFNTIPDELFDSSCFVLFKVESSQQVQGEIKNLIRTEIQKGSGKQKDALDKQFNSFLSKNNQIDSANIDFYIHVTIDNSGSMYESDVPDVADWINEIQLNYPNMNILNSTSDSGEEWIKWILDALDDYESLVPGKLWD